MSQFYQIQEQFVINAEGNKVVLHGVNLGGWLMPEGYFMQAPNLGYQFFRNKFSHHCGEKTLLDLEKSFRDHWIKEEDIQQIAALKFNCVRVPFHYQLIETQPHEYSEEGVDYLDRVIRWSKKYQLGVILDLHAAPGGQSAEWHCDSDGQAHFWNNPSLQKRACDLWAFLARRYKNNPTVIGYDLLNEPDTDRQHLNHLYQNMIKAIRSVDPNHIIFLEGNKWALDLSLLDDFSDDNICFSVHFYEPVNYVFNLEPNLTHPLPHWHKRDIKKALNERISMAKTKRLPVLVGEFGISDRANQFNEAGWLQDTLEIFKELGLHRTYWTYKTIKNTMFPDGIFSYFPNKPWVNRQGPLSGWDTWHLHWENHRQEMIDSWDTKHFTSNNGIIKLLKKFAV